MKKIMGVFSELPFSQLNSLIETMYNAPNLRKLQQVGLSGLRKIVPIESGVFFLTRGTNFVDSYSEDLSEGLFEQYKSHYEPLDAYKKAVFEGQTIPAVDRSSDYLDYTQWEKNEHRADFLLKNGMYYIACVQVFDENKLVGEISLHRNKRQRDFQDWEMKALQLAGRHLSTAFRNLRLVQENEILKTGLSQVFEFFDEAFFIFNFQYDLLYINDIAKNLINNSNSYTAESELLEQLKVCCRKVGTAECDSDHTAPWAYSLNLNTPVGKRLFHVFARKDAIDGSPIFIVVSPPSTPNMQRLNVSLLDRLSKREKDIARLLADGKSNEEMATKLFLSVNTIKTHVHNIFLKTGVESRTELISKMFSL